MHSPVEMYRQVEKATLEGRPLEAYVLRKAAMRLKEAKERLIESNDQETLDEALRYNQRLWTLFQAELGSADHPLPEEIRRNLLTLSDFIDRRTFALMAEPNPDRIDVLIEINRNIADGLAG